MIYGVSDSTLREYMIKNGLISKGHKCGKNSNNDYFKNIDSFDKAYFLGLLAADGSIVKRNGTNSWSVTLCLTEEDEYILHRFNEYGKFKQKIRTIHAKDPKPRKEIHINSFNMKKDLEKYGIIPRKSYTDSVFIPQMPHHLIGHFIRGYFDGNGIAFSNGNIGFCGSKKIIEDIHDFLIKELNISNRAITYNKQNHVYYTQWNRKEEIEKIFEFLYKDCKDLFLTRKHTKIHKKIRPAA